MSGGDKLTARFMRQDYFRLSRLNFYLSIVGNNSHQRRGTWASLCAEGLHIVPFTESF